MEEMTRKERLEHDIDNKEDWQMAEKLFKIKGVKSSDIVKSKCCKKFEKSENKRCKKCPCFDLLKQTA